MQKETFRSWSGKYLNEFIGAFILILFGDGAVMVSVILGGYNLYGVGIMWAFGVMFGIYVAGGVSGAHLNPAITLAQATYRKFHWKHVPAYIGAQLAGAFFAAAVLYGVFSGAIEHFEAANGIVRGAAGSELSAMPFHCFFPNPAFAEANSWALEVVSPYQAFFSEVVITAVLVGVLFALTDERNPWKPKAGMGAFLIGLLVGALVAFEAPCSMAALNPARDLGPRLLTYLAGWGQIAFPGPRNCFWLFTVSTLIGGLIGGLCYEQAVGKFLAKEKEE